MSNADNTTATETEVVTKVDNRIKISMDESEMTLGDLELFEDITGMGFGDAIKLVPIKDEKGNKIPDPENRGRPMMETKMSMKGMVAMVYIAMRKQDPEITLEKVRAMKISEYDFSGEPDPQVPEPSGTSEQS